MRAPTRTRLRKMGVVVERVRTPSPIVQSGAERKRVRRAERNRTLAAPAAPVSFAVRQARIRNQLRAEIARERRQREQMARLAADDCQARTGTL